jgi:septal ring-binding cell division protein DamX
VLVFQSKINRLFEDKSTQTKTIPIPLVEHTPPPTPTPTPVPTPPITATIAPTPTPSPAATVATDVPERQEKVIPLQAPTPDTSTTPAATAPTSTPAVSAPPAATAPVAEAKPAPPETAATPAPSLQVHTIEPSPVPPATTPQTITINGEGITAETTVLVSWSKTQRQIPAARVQIVNDKQIQVQLTVGNKHDKWQLWLVDPKHGKSNVVDFTVATATASATLGKDNANEWVLAQEPGSFTLQLFGSHDKKNAEEFIRRHQLGKQANYFVSEHQGKDWYSVVYGVYPDQAAASAAIPTLPASLKKTKPWIRRLDDIQASVNSSRKVLQKPTPPQPQAQSKPSKATSTPPKHGDVKQYESWIWSQDPRAFTLQLMGARETNSINKFLKQYPSLDGNAIYFHTRHDSRDWYTVIYGVYPDKQKALAAIRRLPPELQKASPWIRSFASIHAELARTE